MLNSKSTLWLCLAVPLLLQGCASNKARPLPGPSVETVRETPMADQLPPEPSPTSGASLGSVGVAAAPGTPEPGTAAPPVGRTGGFRRGATAGAKATIMGGLAIGLLPFAGGAPPCQGQGCGAILFWTLGWPTLGVVAAPVGAVVGGVAGAVKAQSREQVERGKASFINAVARAKLPQSIRDEVVRLGFDRAGRALVPLTRQGPEMADGDVDTVLDIRVRDIVLERRTIPDKTSAWADIDPELYIRVALDVSLIKASDGEVLYSKGFEEYGAGRRFSAWAAGDGLAFREGLVAAATNLAIQITDAVFPRPSPATEKVEPEHELMTERE